MNKYNYYFKRVTFIMRYFYHNSDKDEVDEYIKREHIDYLEKEKNNVKLSVLMRYNKELNVLIRAMLPNKDKEKLIKFLKDNNIYSDFDEEQKMIDKKISEILSRGKITSEEEYEIVNELIEELVSDNPTHKDLEDLGRILDEFNQQNSTN